MSEWDFPVPAVVEVDWLDSRIHHGWGDRQERLREPIDAGVCKSIGYLVQDDDEWLGLAESVSKNDNTGCTTFIPRIAVKAVRFVREA